VTGRDLRGALDAVLGDKPVDSNQRPSIGCSIKWKAGNEPEKLSGKKSMLKSKALSTAGLKHDELSK
jgi:hypothetical protein